MTLKTLTPYPQASFRELFQISYPIILSTLSGFGMIFIDRLFLAYYSLEAMNGAATAGTVAHVFLLIPLSICSVSEVFVGQYNGAKSYKKAASAAWQMIFLAFAATPYFLISAFYGMPFLVETSQHAHALPYSNWFLGAGCLSCGSSALIGFFSGIGKTRIMLYAVVAGNIVNVILDPLFIFGYGAFPRMGGEGAAIATVLGEAVVFSILLWVFFQKPLREKFETHLFKWNKEIFLKSIKIGLPNSLSRTLELLGWSLLIYFSAKKGDLFLTVFTIGQNFFLLFIFFTEGLEKGITAIASNLIGDRKTDLMGKLLRSAAKLHCLWFLAVFPFLIIWPTLLLDIFEVDTAQSSHGSEIYTQNILGLRYLWLFMFIDGLVWVLAGILKSAGDTLFILFTNPACSALFGFIPCIYLMEHDLISPGNQRLFLCLYALVNLSVFYARYQSGKWQKMNVNDSK